MFVSNIYSFIIETREGHVDHELHYQIEENNAQIMDAFRLWQATHGSMEKNNAHSQKAV